MPERMTCNNCGAVGLIRRERVISGHSSSSDYRCGQCGYSWTVRDHNERRTAARANIDTDSSRGTRDE